MLRKAFPIFAIFIRVRYIRHNLTHKRRLMPNRRFQLRRMTVRARVDALNTLQTPIVGSTVVLQEKSTMSWTVSALDDAGLVIQGPGGMTAHVNWDEQIYVE